MTRLRAVHVRLFGSSLESTGDEEVLHETGSFDSAATAGAVLRAPVLRVACFPAGIARTGLPSLHRLTDPTAKKTASAA